MKANYYILWLAFFIFIEIRSMYLYLKIRVVSCTYSNVYAIF